MDALTLSTVCILCATSPGPHPESVAQWQPLIAQASQQFAVPPAWIAGVMGGESRGHTHLNGRPITSPAGAMGLMQVMPDTYAALRQRYRLGPDPYDPHDNIVAGAAYLRELYCRYGYPAMFAAYNAGPKRYEDFLLRGTALPRATLAYVDTIAPGLSAAFGGKGATASSPPRAAADGLFVALTIASPASGPPPQAPLSAWRSPASGLFVRLTGLAR